MKNMKTRIAATVTALALTLGGGLALAPAAHAGINTTVCNVGYQYLEVRTTGGNYHTLVNGQCRYSVAAFWQTGGFRDQINGGALSAGTGGYWVATGGAYTYNVRLVRA